MLSKYRMTKLLTCHCNLLLAIFQYIAIQMVLSNICNNYTKFKKLFSILLFFVFKSDYKLLVDQVL